jgi:mTERF domain-containing protein
LVGKAGLSLEEIARYPNMLVRSLDSHSRRCAVLALLRKEGKQQGNHLVPVVLVSTVKRFFEVYVQPHQIEIPEVALAFNGEIPFEGFGVLQQPQPLGKTSL